MVKKHIAKTGADAGKWTACAAQQQCRNGGAHVDASTLKEAKKFIKEEFNQVIPVKDISLSLVNTFTATKKFRETGRIEGVSSPEDSQRIADAVKGWGGVKTVKYDDDAVREVNKQLASLGPSFEEFVENSARAQAVLQDRNATVKSMEEGFARMMTASGRTETKAAYASLDAAQAEFNATDAGVERLRDRYRDMMIAHGNDSPITLKAAWDFRHADGQRTLAKATAMRDELVGKRRLDVSDLKRMAHVSGLLYDKPSKKIVDSNGTPLVKLMDDGDLVSYKWVNGRRRVNEIHTPGTPEYSNFKARMVSELTVNHVERNLSNVSEGIRNTVSNSGARFGYKAGAPREDVFGTSEVIRKENGRAVGIVNYDKEGKFTSYTRSSDRGDGSLTEVTSPYVFLSMMMKDEISQSELPDWKQ